MPDPPVIASVQPLLARAKEVRAADPIVSYFCRYLAVKRVLETKLHNSDPKVADFVTDVLTELEQMNKTDAVLQSDQAKSILADNDASKQYVLKFATSVLDNAVGQTETLAVTRATASAFAAAAVFLDLESVWQPPSAATVEKIRFAKYQAARILRAIRNGQDPNEIFRTEQDAALAEAGLDATPGASEAPVDDGSTFETGAPSEGTAGSDTRDRSRQTADRPVLGNSPEAAPEPEYAPQPQFIAPVLEPGHLPAVPVLDPRSREPAAPAAPRAVMELTQVTNVAQKHAKYAMSALNYDDVKTAMAELEAALKVLKAFEGSE